MTHPVAVPPAAVPPAAPARRHRRLTVAGAAVLLVLTTVAVGLVVLRHDRTPAGPAAKAAEKREFVLEVTGSQNLATRLGWGVVSDTHTPHELGDGFHPTVTLPWRTTIEVTKADAGVIAVGAAAPRGAGVSCRILQDGVVIAEERDKFAASCSISVRRAFLD